MIIRQERETDYKEIYELIKEAFASAEHADGNEQDLVTALRKGSDFVPKLALVAEIDGKLAGHIMFSKAKIGNDTVLALAPLSVKPEFQRLGVGTALMNKAHKIAKELGYQYSLVLGSEFYYPRVGYLPAEQFGVIVPEGIPSENLMILKLDENAESIGGEVTYAKEFGM